MSTRPSQEFRFVFLTKDYEGTVAFCRDGLELSIIGGWDRGSDDRGTLFGAASGIIEAIYSPDEQVVPPQGLWLLFEVDNVDEMYQRIRAKGLPIKRELTDLSWGARTFKLIDPNGIELSLFSKIDT